MNKASFLTLVRQASRISDQDVEELEKLVVNFPYCQTAHLLIAKAAYDKGSMLSNQKLKKAAIYAANRQLLKKLIYTSDATVTLHPVENPETIAETAEKVTPSEIAPLAPFTPEILPEPEFREAAELQEVDLDPDVSVTENSTENLAGEITPETDEMPAELSEIIAALTQAEVRYEDAAIAEEILEEGYLPATEAEFLGPLAEEEERFSYTFELASGFDFETEVPETIGFEAGKVEKPTSAISEVEIVAEEIEAEPAEVSDAEKTIGFEAEKVGELLNAETPVDEEQLKEVTIPETEAGIEAESEFEAEEIAQELVAEAAHTMEDVPDMHELFLENAPETLEPETAKPSERNTQLHDELLHETLASFDQYLFRPEKETEELQPEEDLKVVYPKDAIQEIFEKDSIGYWMNSSRLGESLELKNELTKPQPYDFYPELILEYSKTHEIEKEIKPVVSNLSRQLEIIDEFLKLTPRLKNMANSKLKTEPQEDLSSKSSKINKNLASENFANILVQQGKIKKAIKIYEHLILKIPEKKAYFVAQIEKLQNQ